MPVVRKTIPKTIVSKLATQFNKKENAQAKQLFLNQQRTVNPRGDTIIWEPSPEALTALVAILEREESFTRDNKKGKCAHLLLKGTIEDLKSAIPVLEPTS